MNISGARHNPGAPIILYPCSGAPNESWTLIEYPGSAVWSLKSDLTGLCLNAQAARQTTRLQTVQAASLTQMPYDVSLAQRLNNADAAWVLRAGPH